jgi:hypothetical protein
MVTEWPQVYPNIIAQVMWSGPIWVWHHWHLKRLIIREFNALADRENQ